MWLCSSLVDATRHVFNELGFVLQAAVEVVGLHARLDFTPDGGAQLSAQRAILGRKNNNTHFIFKQDVLFCFVCVIFFNVKERFRSHHSFPSLDFLDDRLHVKVSKLGPRRGGQLHRARRKELRGIREVAGL